MIFIVIHTALSPKLVEILKDKTAQQQKCQLQQIYLNASDMQIYEELDITH